MDEDGFLEQQLSGVSGNVNHFGLLSFDGPSKHAPLLQTSPVSLSCRPLDAPSTWSPAFSWSHQCSS